jgi:archaeal type IV pilus assembly protein PilA
LTVRIEGTLLYLRNTVSLGNFKVNRKILSGKAKERRAISPIIATLLLILIAIAAGVVVYAYVIGFVGNSTTNTGNSQSTIQVTSSCISASTHCNGGAYYIIVSNVGSTTLSSGGIEQIYFTDISQSTTSTISCTLAASLAPGSQVTISPTTGCSALTGSIPTSSAGDTITMKIVASDGGSATGSTKEIS